MKVLITDDSKAMRMIVKRTLRQAGYDFEVVEATDGAEGLEAVKTHSPDLVLSDWNMPNMSGLEFLQALKAEDIDVKFGFVTSEGTAEMRELASTNGALFLISKPFTKENFQDALAPVLA